MNPEQIDIVVGTWHDACRDGDRLHDALASAAAALGLDARDTIRTTTRPRVPAGSSRPCRCLSPVIDRPTRFTASAGDLMARRGAITMSELGADQSALLGALGELLGAFTDEEQRAWSLALKLFEEAVAATCLDPFGAAPGAAAAVAADGEPG